MNGIIFDMDGVLADTEGIIAEATIKMFHDLYGVDMSPEDFHPFIGTGAIRYVEGPAENFGITIDIDKAVAVRHENFAALLESGKDISLPGVHPLVNAAAAHPHWKLAIATSSPREKSLATIKAARLDPGIFDAYIHGDMITHKKPDPEICYAAAEALGLPPSQCVVIEDAITGIAAAKAAGMKAIAVTNSFPAEKLAQADRIVPSLEEVTLESLETMLDGPGKSP